MTYAIHSRREKAYFAFGMSIDSAHDTLVRMGFTPTAAEPPPPSVEEWIFVEHGDDPRITDVCNVVPEN